MKLIICALSLLASAAATAQTTLDTFIFDDNLFGDYLIESDGGSYSFGNWLNVVNSNPGNPGFLTGVGFDTGVANIGLGSNVSYTIGYNLGIVNRPGADLGIVVARFSEDPVRFAVSQDGTSFGADQDFGAATGVDTGVMKTYFYGGGGPFEAELFVHPIDLSDFGIAEGSSILATRTTGTTQLDLIRVAGLYAVPEPATIAVFGLGALALLRRRRR